MVYRSSLSTESLPYQWPLPSPFLFNTLKHHHHHALLLIQKLKEGQVSVELALDILLKTGNCMIDFYYGSLTPVAIVSEIKFLLQQKGLFDHIRLREQIQSCPGKYLNLTLSDDSMWTIVLGRQNDAYVHIHPSRGSKFVIRINALVLRTAIFLRAFYLNNQDLVTNVNLVRIGILGEPPIKNISYTKGLQRLLEKLED